MRGGWRARSVNGESRALALSARSVRVVPFIGMSERVVADGVRAQLALRRDLHRRSGAMLIVSPPPDNRLGRLEEIDQPTFA
jgi:hypothetical protein